MKYLKDKNTRRRGVAMEMAIMVLLVLTLLSTITVSAATILINKQSSAQKEFTEKIDRYDYDTIGEQFFNLVSNGKTEDEIKNELTVPSGLTAVITLNTENETTLYELLIQFNLNEGREVEPNMETLFSVIVEKTQISEKIIYTIKSWEYQ